MSTRTAPLKGPILSCLDAIEQRLANIESALTAMAAVPAMSVQEAVLREKLDNLTFKRHAVLTATLGNLSYQQIAAHAAKRSKSRALKSWQQTGNGASDGPKAESLLSIE